MKVKKRAGSTPQNQTPPPVSVIPPCQKCGSPPGKAEKAGKWYVVKCSGCRRNMAQWSPGFPFWLEIPFQLPAVGVYTAKNDLVRRVDG